MPKMKRVVQTMCAIPIAAVMALGVGSSQKTEAQGYNICYKYSNFCDGDVWTFACASDICYNEPGQGCFICVSS